MSKSIYQRLNEVMKVVRYVQKDKAVSGGGANYKAVTHDQAVSVCRQALVDNGVMIFPEQIDGGFLVMRDLNATPAPVKMGLYSGTYNIHFVNIDDGSDRVTVRVQAHANDNGDKAPGKALTYATKSAILKVLCLETGENDESREEARDKLDTIDQPQYNELARSCLQNIDGGYQWTAAGEAVASKFGINSLEYLPKSKFESAKTACSGFIDADQVETLAVAIVDAGMTLDQFCSHKRINIPTIAHLPPERLDGALAWLNTEASQ